MFISSFLSTKWRPQTHKIPSFWDLRQEFEQYSIQSNQNAQGIQVFGRKFLFTLFCRHLVQLLVADNSPFITCRFCPAFVTGTFFGSLRVQIWKREAGRGGGLAEIKFPALFSHPYQYRVYLLSLLPTPWNLNPTTAVFCLALPLCQVGGGSWQNGTVQHLAEQGNGVVLEIDTPGWPCTTRGAAHILGTWLAGSHSLWLDYVWKWLW